MLRVTTLYASSAAATALYYTRYLTDAPGEEPGVWTGAKADRLGLSGRVSTEALAVLLEGRDPISGTPLGLALTDRVLANGKTIRAVAGFDATFSAPKSVSVLWALTGDPAVLDVHTQAVRVALANLERFGATTRVRVNGTRQHPDTNGLTMRRSSRPPRGRMTPSCTLTRSSHRRSKRRMGVGGRWTPAI